MEIANIPKIVADQRMAAFANQVEDGIFRIDRDQLRAKLEELKEVEANVSSKYRIPGFDHMYAFNKLLLFFVEQYHDTGLYKTTAAIQEESTKQREAK